MGSSPDEDSLLHYNLSVSLSKIFLQYTALISLISIKLSKSRT